MLTTRWTSFCFWRTHSLPVTTGQARGPAPGRDDPAMTNLVPMATLSVLATATATATAAVVVAAVVMVMVMVGIQSLMYWKHCRSRARDLRHPLFKPDPTAGHRPLVRRLFCVKLLGVSGHMILTRKLLCGFRKVEVEVGHCYLFVCFFFLRYFALIMRARARSSFTPRSSMDLMPAPSPLFLSQVPARFDLVFPSHRRERRAVCQTVTWT